MTENPPVTPDEVNSTPVKTRRTARLGKSFSSRNPTPIGAIGLVLLLALLYAAFNVSSLPLIGGGTEYSAYFTESANLKSGDDVRIAGIKVGTVQDVSIDQQKGLVKVTFTVKDAWVGDQSTVDIKLKTLLGAKYLNVNSVGINAQPAGQVICDPTPDGHGCKRTTSPFDVYPAFTKLTQTINDLDTANLTKAFQTLAQDFKNTPQYVPAVVQGLSRLSTTISSRDQSLRTLLTAAQGVTGVLASRDQDLTQLLNDGNLLLQELTARRDAIHSLLLNTQVLAAQLRGLVADNQKTIGPLLDNLDRILALLQNNTDNLERGISLLGPFYRVFNNVIGNGRWFDNYIENLNANGILCQLPIPVGDCTQ